MHRDGSTRAILERQWLHVVALIVALPILWKLSSSCACFHRGSFLGISTWNWFWVAVEIPIAHQLFVWFIWRMELHRRLISRTCGRTGFVLYALVFTAFLFGRLMTISSLSIASRGTLPISAKVSRPLALIVAALVVYLVYSVFRYFGLKRALGEDHFDLSYRSKPLVREGFFRCTRNAMYTFGLMVLYIPALWFSSRPAMVAAVFGHLYIWIHYFTTELPDMRRIYARHPVS